MVEATVRIYMQEPEKMTGYPLQVPMPYAEESDSQQQSEHTLPRLEDGDTTQAEVPDEETLSIIHGYKAALYPI